MNGDAVADLLIKWSENSGVEYLHRAPPAARFVTGNQYLDARIYQFESAAGVELTILKDDITDYRVVDQRRWVEFVLKYA